MTATPFLRTGYESFEEMYRAERSFVFDIARSRVRNQAVADDLTQDVFVKVLRFLDHYATPENKPLRGSFKHWLGTIALNVVNSYFTRRNIEQRSLWGEAIEERYNLKDDNLLNAEDLLQRKEDLEVVMRALESIADPRRKETARLWFIEGLDYNGICSKLSVPRGTVMSRLSRARDEMRNTYYGKE